MVIKPMLDTIDDASYKLFLSPIFGLMNKIGHPNTSSMELDVILQKLDLLLEVAMPLISVQPVIITIGYLRATFLVREMLPHWQLFLEEALLQFGIKFKPYKVENLLRGLSTT